MGQKTSMPKLHPKREAIVKAALGHNLQVEVDAHDLKILAKGPFLIIANTILDEVDNYVLMELLSRQSTPFQIVSRKKKIPKGFEEFFLPVDAKVLNWEDYVKKAFKQMRKAKDMEANVAFTLRFTDRSLDTPVRNQLLDRLMKVAHRVGMPIVCLRLKTPFPDFVRPNLGKRLIQRKRDKPYIISVRVGSPISLEEQGKFNRAKDFRRFIQSKIFSLGTGLQVKHFFRRKFFIRNSQEMQPLASTIGLNSIRAEIRRLPKETLIASQAEYDIYVVEAQHIPKTLTEIGRLRELTFREVDEGTGRPYDTDEYDLYYRQLILWDREAGKIVGGYRMGLGEEIFSRYGANGFYISSLFKIKQGFHPTMQQSVELGRSYVVPEYQRKRLPLFLLWKGILYFLLKNPQYRYLYGPVSISKYYSNISRSLIVSFIRNYYFNHDLAKNLTPRKPFRAKVDKVDVEMLAANLGQELKSLDNLIADIEPDHIRIPVLVRQYLKLNARFISFNVDPNFSDVLDGFIILNLKDLPEAMVEALKKEM